MVKYLKIALISFCILALLSSISFYVIENFYVSYEILIGTYILSLCIFLIPVFLLKHNTSILLIFLSVIYTLLIMLFEQVLTKSLLCNGEVQFLDNDYKLLYTIILLALLTLSIWYNFKSISRLSDKIFPLFIGILYYYLLIKLGWLTYISIFLSAY